MSFLIFIPFIVQTLVILFDECCFHLKRGLPKWERIGHPLDTLSVLFCLGFVFFVPYSPTALKGFLALSILSCLLVTKDEFVHKHHCPASEQWLHALLFLNHPIMLASIGLMWSPPRWISPSPLFRPFLALQMGFITLFFLYQLIYWNLIWKESK